MILTTTDGVPGRTVASTVGMVVACVPYFGTTYLEGIKDLKGVTHPNVAHVLERRRAEVLARLVANASATGADAVVAVRLTEREITASWKELCAYGTAVNLSGVS